MRRSVSLDRAQLIDLLPPEPADMGIYDREYYRGETRGSAWWSGATPVCNALIIINVAVFLFQNFAKLDPGGEVFGTWL